MSCRRPGLGCGHANPKRNHPAGRPPQGQGPQGPGQDRQETPPALGAGAGLRAARPDPRLRPRDSGRHILTGSRGPQDGRCFCCGRAGHWVATCPHKTGPEGLEWRLRMARSTGDKCGSCGQAGHWAADCPGR
ncbi:MAG: hypothetical protein F4Y61_08110 [Rhodothermaceae bacterium]|nr:hypothetical protein [Rhodothermaceae bacterium]